MGIQYRKAKIKLGYKPDKPEVYKMQQLTYPAIGFDMLVGDCAQACGVNVTQTRSVINALVNRMLVFLEIGHGVQLGEFGSFKPTFTAKTSTTYDGLSLKNVRVKKIQFFPGKAFKNMLDNLDLVPVSEFLNDDVPED